MPQTASPPAALKRRLGPTLLTLYGIGVMVGAGIFVLVGTVAGSAGMYAPAAFLAAGLIAAPTALTYSELSVRIPESAGEAAYVLAALRSKTFATAIGLAIVVAGTASAAAVLKGGVGYMTDFVGLSTVTLTLLVAALIVGLAAWGVVESLAVAGVLTAIEVGGLLLVIWAGFRAPTSADWQAGLPEAVPWGGLGLAVVLAFFAFIGFEDIVNLAEEVRNPSRSLPIAIVTSLVVASLLYGAVSIAAIRSVDGATLEASERPLTLVVEQAGISTTLLAGIAALAALNGMLAQIVMSARVLFGLGRHEPRIAVFHQTNPRFGTPTRATFTIGAAVLAGALVFDITALAELTSTFLLFVFCVVNGSLILIKRRGGPPTEGISVPVWVPWLGLIGSLIALGTALVV